MKKRLVMLLATIGLAAGTFAATQSAEYGGYTWYYTVVYDMTNNVTYTMLYNDGACAVSPSPSGALEIPATLGGNPVTAIGMCAFAGCANITSVTIPDGVTSIAEAAFYYCTSLTSLTIPSSVVSIEDLAFRSTPNINTVFVPSGGTEGIRTLLQNSGLNVSGITFVEQLSIESESVGGYTWYYTVVYDMTNNVTYTTLYNNGACAVSPAPSGSLEIPATLGGYPVTSIGENTFVACTGITSLTIPEGVTSIGGDAFYGCSNLSSMTIPASLTTISSRAFNYTGLETVYVTAGRTDAVRTMLQTSGLDVSGITFIDSSLWNGNLSMLHTDVTVTDGMVLYGTLGLSDYCKISIAPGATVTLSNAYIYGTYGHSSPFAGITCLGGNTTIILEGTNTVNGFDRGYPGIYVPTNSSLTITGNGMLSTRSNIGYAAGIGGGDRLDCGDIAIEGGTVIAEGTYYAAGIGGGYQAKCGTITIGADIVKVVAKCGASCNNPIGNGYLGTGATVAPLPTRLIDTTDGSTRTIEQPPSEQIDGYTWHYHLISTIIDITNNVSATTAEVYNDRACAVSPAPSGELEIPATLGGYPVTSIGETAFVACTGITSLTIPEGVTSIGGDAFYGCSNMRSMTIPASLTTITSRAFNYTGLETVYVTAGRTDTVRALLQASGCDVSGITFIEPWLGDLSALTGNVTVPDGMVLYGTLGGPYKVTIAAGATVTLSNAVINGSHNASRTWAGITCLGDATIVLAEGNTVKGFEECYPGIHVPVGSTLTIRGSGSLTARSSGWGAGIGGGWGIPCGNIAIQGGTITAEGGGQAAGIGSGGGSLATCGTITISGGNISATGGSYSAGIGTGYYGTCGAITIELGITRVIATHGSSCDNAIGAGEGGTCPDPVVDSDLNDKTSTDRMTRTISPGGYEVWNSRWHLGAWNETDANGIYNVFRYAFSKPPMAGKFTLINITFDTNGRVVIVTPPLVNTAGFSFSVLASDKLDGTGNAQSYTLDASGETVINETKGSSRFFRLWAEEK